MAKRVKTQANGTKKDKNTVQKRKSNAKKKSSSLLGLKLDTLEEYIKFIEKSNIDELEIEERGTRVVISRSPKMPVYQAAPMPAGVFTAGGPVQAQPAAAVQDSAAGSSESGTSVNDDLIHVKSPIIGTFYAAPSPTSPSFVNLGDIVDVDQTLCIIEAMKMMNNIKTQESGKIVKICKKNEESVQAGDDLFLLERV